MAALDSLRREHALIVRALDALDAYAERVERGTFADAADLRRFAAFFMEFGELWHHDKEEDILLPALVKHGYAWDGGMVARLRAGHEQETYLIRVLEQAALQEGESTEADRAHLVASIRSLVLFERTHIADEEASAYRAVAEELPAEAEAEIDRRFQELEASHFSLKSYDEVEREAALLFARYSGAGPTGR